MKIELEVLERENGVEFPWWFILDGGPETDLCKTDRAYWIKGPFFSRAEADEQLKVEIHNHGEGAKVKCASAFHSYSYKQAIYAAENKKVKKR